MFRSTVYGASSTTVVAVKSKPTKASQEAKREKAKDKDRELPQVVKKLQAAEMDANIDPTMQRVQQLQTTITQLFLDNQRTPICLMRLLIDRLSFQVKSCLKTHHCPSQSPNQQNFDVKECFEFHVWTVTHLTRFEGRGHKKFPKGPSFAHVFLKNFQRVPPLLTFFLKNFQRVPPLLTFFEKISKGSPLCLRFFWKISKGFPLCLRFLKKFPKGPLFPYVFEEISKGSPLCLCFLKKFPKAVSKGGVLAFSLPSPLNASLHLNR